MENALEVRGVTKTYGKNTALDDISFEIKKGEFFGFLGPNGAGKTTTIHLATGINRMERGVIKVFGVDVVKEYREARKHIGLSPQEFNVDIFKDIPTLLHYIGGYYGMTKKERDARIEELVERFDLTKHLDKEFMKLSGGTKRRVMLARALMHDPEFIILDEPTAGVDVELRHDLWRYLREMNENGKTILLTSHYLEEVEMLCKRIAIINAGKIVAVGDKSEFTEGGKKLEERYLEVTQAER